MMVFIIDFHIYFQIYFYEENQLHPANYPDTSNGYFFNLTHYSTNTHQEYDIP
jgi:hypothetical protein